MVKQKTIQSEIVKNIMFKISLFFLIFIFFSCTNDDLNKDYYSNNNLLSGYTLSAYNTIFSDKSGIDLFFGFNSSSGNINFFYQENKLVKRIGKPYFNSINYNIYDTIYQNNKTLYIETKLIPHNGYDDISPNKKEYIYGKYKRILRKIRHNEDFNFNDNDTTFFFYKNSRLDKQINRNIHSNFYYNTKGNLDSITYRYKISDSGNLVLGSTFKKEVFEEYDNSPNPFKNLMIFEDIFKRSLSNNNYRKHRVFFINPYYLSYHNEFTIQYDLKGDIIY